jgi:hypothetical protein
MNVTILHPQVPSSKASLLENFPHKKLYKMVGKTLEPNKDLKQGRLQSTYEKIDMNMPTG